MKEMTLVMYAFTQDTSIAKALLKITSIASASLLLATTGASLAQEQVSTPSLRVELNRLEAAGDNCRAYFLIDNKKGEGWRSLKLDLFALDMDGVAAKRLAVEIGPVPGQKTIIKLFDFVGLACPHLGRILLNDVVACEGTADTREACLSAIDTASKIATVPFAK